MDRTFESGAAGSPPSVPASPSSGYPTAGNPQAAVAATKPGPWWYHMMTEELRAVIVAAGLTPDHTDVTQLSQAIQALFIANQKAVVINGATFEASVSNGEVVRWDAANNRFDEAIADGTANNRAVGIADVTNGKVYLYGECPLFSGLTPGARYYLSAGTLGAITTTAPTDAVMVGIAKSVTTLWVDVDAAPAQQGVEVGSVIFVAKNTAPTGYLKANGAAVSRTTYAALFAAIGTTFGAGDGSTTFILPDLRGEFVRGWDDGRGVDSGRAFGSSQADDFKSHSHNIPYSDGYSLTNLTAERSGVQDGTYPTSVAGGTETRPRNVALLSCIKY